MGCVPLPGNRTLVVGVGLVKTCQGETQVTKSTVLGAEIHSAPFSSFTLGLSTQRTISTTSTNVIVEQQ
jgi:hypothetical protein